VSLAEFYEGIHYSLDPARCEAALRRFLAGVSAPGVDAEICGVSGPERAPLPRQGRMIGDFDLLIAATSLRNDPEISTNNRRHFEVVEGLRILRA